ncbi:hypothetical protein CDL12_20924 [Handroanthus impetiginosus]|uniref:PLAC8 motif-containing protein n=1 Tax=Handroanthus impetiginosus TaxID=429701 RepID=A0A2G9GMM6_9LAMI|nr:hypothetical protein CDL12_20924 [Handroanthus impetiginosus]
MGRIDPNATTQYHQGLQSQEPIDDDAPPHEDNDLYEPPSDYHKPKKLVTNHDKIKPRPNMAQPQAFPPQQEDDENATQCFPPEAPININGDDEDDFNKTQAFPPRQPETAVPNVGGQFTPGGQSGNLVHHHQPVAGGIPVQPGVTPSPLLMPNQLLVASPQPWKTHLFGCMEDPQNAIITVCFPCVTFGQIAEVVDSGGTSCGTSGMLYSLIACCIAMPCLMSCGYRSKLRARFGLVESPAPDWLVHCFCECCALCQEYRELQTRGLDPSIGWMGNVAKQRQQMQQFGMTPPMQQRMM